MTVPTQRAEPRLITEAGVIDGMPEWEYHADPVPAGSLSSTGARRIVPPGCPALFDYERRNPKPSTAAQEYGTVAHKEVLGVGGELYPYAPIDGRTKDGKAQAADLAAARAAGKTPVTTDDYARIKAMAEAVRQHELAAALLDPSTGKAEQSAFAQDDRTGTWLRCRYDWLPEPANGRLIFADYKTTDRLDDDSIAREIAKWKYHQQIDFYEHVAQLLGLAETVFGALIFGMKQPPYLVRVVSLDTDSRLIARARNRRAIDLFTTCQKAGVWPGYGDDLHTASLPGWEAKTDIEEYNL